jgi:hypothetical protein
VETAEKGRGKISTYPGLLIKMTMWTQDITRRHLTELVLGATINGLLFINPSWGKTDKPNETDQPSKFPLAKGPFKAFTDYQATVLEEVTALLIPTDQDPGAKEAGVVYSLDQLAMGSRINQTVFGQGVKWLDYMTQQTFNISSFLELDEQERIQLLKFTETGDTHFLKKSLPDLPPKLIEFGKTFFQFILEFTMTVFYTSPSGWKVVRFPGPPQWEGNLDYHVC